MKCRMLYLFKNAHFRAVPILTGMKKNPAGDNLPSKHPETRLKHKLKLYA